MKSIAMARVHARQEDKEHCQCKKRSPKQKNSKNKTRRQAKSKSTQSKMTATTIAQEEKRTLTMHDLKKRQDDKKTRNEL